jgi:diadenosine tetraphosphatase ApaH/serine/threonine PP2A family protein phosphatase
MYAIVSDIHSNIEALEKVLADIDKRHDTKGIICLGDIIGYGANPRECLQIAARRFLFSLIGNHEEAVLMIAEDFNDRARQAVDWTRAALNDREIPREQRHEFWNYLDTLRSNATIVKGRFMFVHGSPRVPTKEYIMPRDVHDKKKMSEIFEQNPGVIFCGHSHVPGVYTEEGEYVHPSKLKDGVFEFGPEKKYIVNVGSVGQPRDQDTRACYVTFTDKWVQFHRLTYDVSAAATKIETSGGLPHYLAERLREGR